jgi:hypothetical protein
VSVMMVLRLDVDPAAFEQVARDQGDNMKAISGRGKAAGAIHHAFYAGDGQVMVVDEWPDEQTFLAFFEAEGPNIGPLMQAAGVKNEPKPEFYAKVDTGDDF